MRPAVEGDERRDQRLADLLTALSEKQGRGEPADQKYSSKTAATMIATAAPTIRTSGTK